MNPITSFFLVFYKTTDYGKKIIFLEFILIKMVAILKPTKNSNYKFTFPHTYKHTHSTKRMRRRTKEKKKKRQMFFFFLYLKNQVIGAKVVKKENAPRNICALLTGFQLASSPFSFFFSFLFFLCSAPHFRRIHLNKFDLLYAYTSPPFIYLKPTHFQVETQKSFLQSF